MARLLSTLGILLLAVGGPSLLAAQPLVLKSGHQPHSIGPFLEYAEDEDGAWTDEEVRAGAYDARFVDSHSEIPNFGITSSVYWIRVKVRNESSLTEWYFVTRWALLDRVDLFLSRGHSPVERRFAGLAAPADVKELGNRNPGFVLALHQGEEVELLLRMETAATLSVDFTFWPPTLFREQDRRNHLFLGLHYGLMIALFLFNVLLFLSSRNRAYVLYSAFLASYVLYHMSLEGFAAEYLWSGSPWWSAHAVLPFCAATQVFGVLFSRLFLESARIVPHLDRLLLTTAVVAGAGGLMSLAAPVAGNTLMAFNGLVVFAGLIVTASLCRARGYRPAGYFLLAWVFFFLGGLLFVLATLGVIPASGFTLNSWHVGAAAGGVLLTFGIGQRIGAMRKDYRRRLAAELVEKRHSLQNNLDRLNKEADERKAFEDKLVDSLKELERSNEELEQFAYVASHDLQEPVRTVGGHLELLARRAGERLPERARIHVEEALRGTAKLQRHIDGLLEYSRITTRGKSFQRLDVDDALDDALARLAPVLEEAKAEVVRAALPTLLADASQVARVFELLLENAVAFRGNAPLRVHVDASEVEGDWVFSVRDNGNGIVDSDRDSVFDVFTRFASDIHPNGIGMGLAIVRRIIERHHGAVWVDGNADGGSTFHFSLPRTGGQSPEEVGGEP